MAMLTSPRLSSSARRSGTWSNGVSTEHLDGVGTENLGWSNGVSTEYLDEVSTEYLDGVSTEYLDGVSTEYLGWGNNGVLMMGCARSTWGE